MRSAGEERLAAALERDLKPPWRIYRNVAWLEKRPGTEPQDGEADLVLAHPDRGVMVIEVKGGGIRRLEPDRWESRDHAGAAHPIKDPFKQVTGAMHRLRRVCEALPAWPVASVRFARAVALPDSAYDHAMTADGPREIVIDHDDLATAGRRVEAIWDWWSRSGDATAEGAPLTVAGLEALDTLLARPLEIPSPLIARVAADEERIALAAQQFAALDMLSSQRRAIVLGVAGSGKTLLAAEKARRLAAQGMDVLLTCFNRPLSEHLAATVGQLPGLTVSTFHRLAESLGQEAGLIGPSPAHDTAYFETLPDILDRALGKLPEHRYDAIVVDEGQDIDSVWWIPLLDLLRDREHGIVYVFGDANQDLYHAREPDELGVVMPEAPPTYYLFEDRRCTRSIHEFAAAYAVPGPDAPVSVSVGPLGQRVEVF
ncbi:MAG: NERD domain-containing protein/DEAD/DEAH box helicase, partial [Chloroflexota bacterium]